MTNAKQYTPRELFEMWLKGKHTVAELSTKYGYCYRALSKKFTSLLNERKKQPKPKITYIWA